MIEFIKNCLNIKDFEYFKENMLIFKCNLKLLKNVVHKNEVVLIDNYYLNLINNDDYDDMNLLLPLINLSNSNYNKYIKQYINDSNFGDYLSLKNINIFIIMKTNNNEYLRKLLMNMDSTDYWINKNKFNLTNKFIDREFKLSLNEKIKDIKIKNLLNDLNEFPKEGDLYLNYLYRNDVHVDIFLVLKNNGYNLYYIDNNLEYSLDLLNNILDDLNENMKYIF